MISCCISFAQSVNPSSLNVSGKTAFQNNIKLSYTVGDITVKSINNSNIYLGQGFTSNAVQSTTVTAIQEADVNILQVRLYPNPTSDMLFVDIEVSKEPNVQISIFDISGKMISREIYTALNNHIGINMQHWQTGSYLLQLSTTDDKTLGSYTILKK